MLIVCNGMKRSGSTLQYNLAASILEKADAGVAQAWVPRNQLKPDEEPLAGWFADERLHAIKSHQLLPDTDRLLSGGRLKVLYSFRDVRDVAASSLRTFDNVNTINDVCSLIDEALEADLLLSAQPGVLRQSYETLTQDTATATKEIAAFLGLTLAPAHVDDITRRHAMDQVQRNIQRKQRIYKIRQLFRPIAERLGLLAIGRSIYRRLFSKQLQEVKKSLVRDNHVSSNQGRSGAWDDVLSADDLRVLEERYGKWLRANGYR